MQHTAADRRVEAALAGEVPMTQLGDEEYAAYNAELDASISETARAISFGEVLAAQGVTSVALDERGRLVRHYPDGTTEVLD